MDNREIICVLSPDQNDNIEKYFGDLYGKNYKILPMSGGRFESALSLLRDGSDEEYEVLDRISGKVRVFFPNGSRKAAYIVCVLVQEGEDIDCTIVRE